MKEHGYHRDKPDRTLCGMKLPRARNGFAVTSADMCLRCRRVTYASLGLKEVR